MPISKLKTTNITPAVGAIEPTDSKVIVSLKHRMMQLARSKAYWSQNLNSNNKQVDDLTKLINDAVTELDELEAAIIKLKGE